MTTIADLEFRIRSAQTVIKNAEGTLERLTAELTELKEQEPKQKQESLCGRWATHPEHGPGIIISDHPDNTGTVDFRILCKSFIDGATSCFVKVSDLTIDPATLNTAKDFEDAPDGTIAETYDEFPDVYEKYRDAWYAAGYDNKTFSNGMPPCRVIRWGAGK